MTVLKINTIAINRTVLGVFFRNICFFQVKLKKKTKKHSILLALDLLNLLLVTVGVLSWISLK